MVTQILPSYGSTPAPGTINHIVSSSSSSSASASCSRSYRVPPLVAVFVLLPLFFLSLILVPGRYASPPTTPLRSPTLSLAIIGDWGRKGAYGQAHVAHSMALYMSNLPSPKSIITTGDNFYKMGVTGLHDDQFNTSFEHVYHQEPLHETPWYPVLGNHDHLGSIRAQIEYSTKSKRWNMPSPYYSKLLAPNVMGIFLDTTPMVDGAYGRTARVVNRQNPVAQSEWFKRQLANADPNMYFVIVGHHNMYSMSIDDHLGNPIVRDILEPIMKPYLKRILAYVSGHEHSLMHMQPRQDGVVVDHFLSGAGSKLHRIVEPPVDEREKWLKCCDILPKYDDPSRSRTVWGSSQNGFFVFQFDGSLFTAMAVDKNQRVVYQYNKTVT